MYKIFRCPAGYLLGQITEKYSTTEQKEVPTLSAKIKDRMDQLQLNQSDLITKSETSEISFENITAGIVFTNSFTGLGTYGKLDNEGCITTLLGYIFSSESGYEYDSIN